MSEKKLKKLLKEKTPAEILTDYMDNKIFLYQRQVEMLCKLGNHIGGVNCR